MLPSKRSFCIHKKLLPIAFGLVALPAGFRLALPHVALAASSSAAAPALASAAKPPAAEAALFTILDTELHRAMTSLGKADDSSQPRPYFLSYAVDDASAVTIQAQYGAIVNSNQGRSRVVDIQLRLGSPAEDNTHGTQRNSALTSFALPLTDDPAAISRSLWFATNQGYARSLDGLLKVRTEAQVRAKEEDTSADFSTEPAQTGMLPPSPALAVDRAAWEQRVREISAAFRQYPDVFSDEIQFQANTETDYFVSSEGSRTANPSLTARLVIVARTRAADGMDLFRDETFEADTAAHLPDQKTVLAKVAELGKGLEALRAASTTEPFNGPAILSGRASAVFFHEVLGHRLEGQRQRGDDEGQTFTKFLGKPILPSFLSVADDPTLATFHGTALSGHYSFDDEGQPSRHVDLIQDGVLKTFLMSRLPVASVAQSNGHGRDQAGHMPTGRQGNLIVTSTKTVTDAQLRQMLIDEAKKQGKPYGLFFEDISSGFAVTTRRSPQAFSVTPLVVYRVYVDGRPDELVRGVSIVGTPQAALNSILATGDHQDVFNGICGAESGSVPVSAVAPAMLMSQIETQREAQGTARPPILPPPGPEPVTAKGAN
ncbi:MAG TPA: metallopeptidase TldD-related protein [Acidobacteriaceae bacterium]